VLLHPLFDWVFGGNSSLQTQLAKLHISLANFAHMACDLLVICSNEQQWDSNHQAIGQ